MDSTSAQALTVRHETVARVQAVRPWSGIRLPVTANLAVTVDLRLICIFLMSALVYFFAAEISGEWLFLMASSLFGAFMLSLVLPLLQVMDVDASVSAPPQAVKGESCQARLTFRRRFMAGPISAFIPVWLLRATLTSVRLGVDKLEQLVDPVIINCLPDETIVVVGTVPLERGVHELKRLTLTSCFPFGLVWWSRAIDLSHEKQRITVYPNFQPITGVFLHRLESAHGSVGLISRRPIAGTQSVCVQGVREYAMGDSPRLIHWASSARTGRLLVRQFEPESEPGFDVLLDLTADWCNQEEFELGVCLANSLLQMGYRMGIGPDLVAHAYGEDGQTHAQLNAWVKDIEGTPPGPSFDQELLARVQPIKEQKSAGSNYRRAAGRQSLLVVRPARTRVGDTQLVHAGYDISPSSMSVELVLVPVLEQRARSTVGGSRWKEDASISTIHNEDAIKAL